MIQRVPVEVYTALLLPLPKSTRLMTPCIRPCFILIQASRGIMVSDMLAPLNDIFQMQLGCSGAEAL